MHWNRLPRKSVEPSSLPGLRLLDKYGLVVPDNLTSSNFYEKMKVNISHILTMENIV